MRIEVMLDEAVIFNGDADDFLYMNDCDTEIEEGLNELNGRRIGATIEICGDFEDVYTITKLEEE